LLHERMMPMERFHRERDKASKQKLNRTGGA